MIFGSTSDVSLCGYDVYEKDGFLWLTLKYSYEAKDGRHELYLPKVALNIPINRIPGCSGTISMLPEGEKLTIHVPDHDYDLYKANVWVEDKNGQAKLVKGVRWTDCLVRENQVEMTIEEIEKQLGHKIKIVSEKK